MNSVATPLSEARERAERSTKLLVVNESIEHAQVLDLTSYISSEDVVVVNDAATLPASFRGMHAGTGASIEIRLLMNLKNEREWRVVVFGEGDWRTPTEKRAPAPKLIAGDQLFLGDFLKAIVTRVHQDISDRLVDVKLEPKDVPLWQAIYRSGRPIQYSYLKEDLHSWDQQTIFSGPPVALEPPSAAFPLSWELVFRLLNKGVHIVSLTHATGVSDTGDRAINRRLPFPERSRIPHETQRAILKARSGGKKVWAIGTGVTRALETWGGRAHGTPVDAEFISNLKITPETKLGVVDGILTGLHEAGASHLSLLHAFIAERKLNQAYAEAKARGYLWHEFGDVCLIEKET